MATRDFGSEQGLFLNTILFVILSGVTILLSNEGSFRASGLALTNSISNPTSVLTTAPASQVPSINIVSVKDQKLDAGIVVNEVKMTDPGFLLIRKTSTNGAPDEIVGKSAYLEAGVYNNLQVSFYTGANKPKLATGNVLAITLVRDDGNEDFDEIDFKNIVADASSKELAAKFRLF